MSNLLDHFSLKNIPYRNDENGWLSFTDAGSMSEKSHRMYRLYSIFYPPLALAAYLLVWRGRLLQHIKFFRDTVKNHLYIIDLATGDGTLTKKALFPLWKEKVKGLLVLDLSEAMLSKAVRKLPKSNTIFLHADVINLPFDTHSVDCLTCFGGFNSFISGEIAMCEMARVLKAGGVLRGSVLLTPKKHWKKKLVDLFIRWGLQTEHVDYGRFTDWIHRSGLTLYEARQFGDVFLFELRK